MDNLKNLAATASILFSTAIFIRAMVAILYDDRDPFAVIAPLMTIVAAGTAAGIGIAAL